MAAPGEEDFDATRLESVVHDVGLSSTVLSLLVARRGELVVEEYFNGGDAAHAHNIFSTTKLLTVLAIGAAADDGIVPGLDTSLGEWVEEIAEAARGSDHARAVVVDAKRTGDRSHRAVLGRGRRRRSARGRTGQHLRLRDRQQRAARPRSRSPGAGRVVSICPRPGPRSDGRLGRPLARDALRQCDRRQLRVPDAP